MIGLRGLCRAITAATAHHFEGDTGHGSAIRRQWPLLGAAWVMGKDVTCDPKQGDSDGFYAGVGHRGEEETIAGPGRRMMPEQ